MTETMSDSWHRIFADSGGLQMARTKKGITPELKDKVYYRHSGYPGGLKSTNLEDLLAKSPTAAIEYAVKGMLPKGPLGRAMFKKLKVYSGPNHKHSAQQPTTLELS